MNKYIAATYRLTSPSAAGEEELIEETHEGEPFVFISGMGLALDAFEAALTPLAAGEKYDFTLTPEEAYGPYMPEAVQDVPRSVFEIDGQINSKYIYEGAIVPLNDAEGNRFNGAIVKIGPEAITVDLNHPLASRTLHFVGEVVESREATNGEIEKMAKMLSGEGCGSESGCCGDCESGCGGCGK